MNPDILTTVDSITNHSIYQNNENDSTIELEFSDSVIQMLALTTKHDSHSDPCPSFHQYYSRKRCASRESQRMINDEQTSSIIKKKQRNSNDHLAFSENATIENQLSESQDNYEQSVRTNLKQQTGLFLKRSVSIQNNNENRLDWLKDFMRQSLDTIRDTVVQACVTAISARTIPSLHSNLLTQDINANNHRNHIVQSEHSFTTNNTDDSWQNHRLRISNDVLLLHNKLDDDNDIVKNQRIHHRARINPYPMYKNVLRIPISDIRVPWLNEWPQYKPTVFTAEEIYINPGADPDLIKSTSSISLHFNTIDGAIDRRSVYRPYHIREYDGLPLNPIGRTGLQGRGVLLRWGPNVYHYVIICRWKRDNHGTISFHPSNGKKILEILLEIQTDGQKTNDFILTGGLRMFGSRFPPQLQDRLRRFIIHTDMILNHRKKISSSLMGLNHLFEQIPTPWKGAYFDDARNTDNAWIELSIEYFLDYDNQFTSCIPCLNHEQLNYLEQPRFVWKDVRNTIDIGPRTHYRLVRNLASKLDAYF